MNPSETIKIRKPCITGKAFVLYFIFMSLVFIEMELRGLLVLDKQSDSSTYLQAASLLGLGELDTVLSSIYVTLGYPLFLIIVSFVSPDFFLLPEIQFIIYGLSVFIFFSGLRMYGFSGLQTLVSACPLLIGQIIREYAHFMLAESLAVSFAIATIGFLMMVVSQVHNSFYWLGLTVSLFMTYQVRPAFLFIIVLIPLLGVALFLIKKRLFWYKLSKTVFVKLIAVSLIPILAFSTLRLATSNHFGVVSFEGYNIVGIATSMLTDELIPKLPVAHQKLATAIVKMRKLHQESVKEAKETDVVPPSVLKFPKYCMQPLPLLNTINHHQSSTLGSML